MGRIADALARAGNRWADTTSPDTLPVSSVMNKWASWYGAAQDDRSAERTSDFTDVPPEPPVAGLSEEIVCYYASSSLVSEQYRALRTRLLSANPHREHRTYAISSAIPKEGKSITTLNLSFSLGEIRHLKTLIVDGDLRHSCLAKLLNCPAGPGLADLLLDQAVYEDVIRPTPMSNLFFLPAGDTQGRSATELFSTRSARAIFSRFQREFHYTIVDTPPATTVADVGIIGQMTSGVILVIRMHRTPEPLARRAIDHLMNNNIPIVGSVVIGDNDPAGGYGQHFTYYRYYEND